MALLTGYLWRQRLTKVRPYLKGRVLDIGCGHAQLIRALSPQQSYTGVEVQADVVERLQAQYPFHRFIAADLNQGCPALSNGAYDTIVMLAVIEHLHNPETLLDQLGPALADDGRMAITTPTPLGDRILHIGRYIGLFNRERVEEHEKLYNKGELMRLLSEHRFAVEHYATFEFGLNQLVVARRSRT